MESREEIIERIYNDENLLAIEDDVFIIGDGVIINVYFNPDSSAGGQIVEDHLDMDDILELKDLPTEDFWDVMCGRKTEYLIDITENSFLDTVDDYYGLDSYSTEERFLGSWDKETQDKLVEIARGKNK